MTNPIFHTLKQQLLGTVWGGGYNCKTGEITLFEGEKVGVWNKVCEMPVKASWTPVFFELKTLLKMHLGFCSH